jgi:hypothetical protein
VRFVIAQGKRSAALGISFRTEELPRSGSKFFFDICDVKSKIFNSSLSGGVARHIQKNDLITLEKEKIGFYAAIYSCYCPLL